MNNEKLIFNIAIANELYTQEEAEQIIADHGELPLHSVQGWKHRSPAGYEYRIKRGEHGLETRLWKKRKGKKVVEDDDTAQDEAEIGKKYFYLAKTYLFTEKQVELVKLRLEETDGKC